MESSEKVQDIPLLTSKPVSLGLGERNLYAEGFKRAFDLFLFILALPFVLPVLLFLMLLIKLDSQGPAIYKSERIGKGGNKFNCLKLRTMCVDADKKLAAVLNTNPALKSEWEKDHKLKEDPRTTRAGKFIRSLSLDELPQIFNVLKGQMSFVGPRPIVEAEISKYGKEFKNYTSLLPGITGLWQVQGRNDISYQERVALDTSYSNSVNWSIDFKIILKTVPSVISKKGAY